MDGGVNRINQSQLYFACHRLELSRLTWHELTWLNYLWQKLTLFKLRHYLAGSQQIVLCGSGKYKTPSKPVRTANCHIQSPINNTNNESCFTVFRFCGCKYTASFAVIKIDRNLFCCCRVDFVAAKLVLSQWHEVEFCRCKVGAAKLIANSLRFCAVAEVKSLLLQNCVCRKKNQCTHCRCNRALCSYNSRIVATIVGDSFWHADGPQSR